MVEGLEPGEGAAKGPRLASRGIPLQEYGPAVRLSLASRAMRTFLSPIVLALLFAALPRSAHAVTEEDRAACRTANPGPAAVIVHAYMACLGDRERVAAEAAAKEAELRRLEVEAREAERRREEAARARQVDERHAQERAAHAAALAQQSAGVEAMERAEAEAAAALKKKCGKDYQRVRPGMKWSRAQTCAGPFELVAEDETGAVYEAPGGAVRVERGRVVRWIARR